MVNLTTLGTRAVLATIRTTSRNLDVDLPAGLTTALDRAERIRTTSTGIGARTAGHGPIADDITTRVFQLLDTGATPDELADDLELRRNLTRHQLAILNVDSSIATRCDKLLADALTDHSDELLSSWADAITADTARLARSATELDVDDLQNDSVVRQLANAAAFTRWQKTVTAAHRVTEYWTGSTSLARRAGLIRNAGDPLLLLVDPDAAATLDTKRLDPSLASTWAIARSGTPLAPAPTLGHYLDRLATRDTNRAAADTEAETARVRHGFG